MQSRPSSVTPMMPCLHRDLTSQGRFEAWVPPRLSKWARRTQALVLQPC
uniref:Uncharacterized protein n=1 Tax=Arundo donax TaxID=35708 RepID=A0A0A9BYA0_ARUDO